VLDWNDLRFAWTIAREQSLSGAARVLGVHQSTAGRRLDALEAALGVSLFVRAATGMTPTSDGARILSAIGDLASQLVLFEQSAQSGISDMRGLVRVAITETGARQVLEGTLRTLLAAHPDLSIELIPGNLAADLSRGEADLAVRLVAPDGGLVARKVGAIRYGLYRGVSYALRRAELAPGLAGHAIVSPSRELAAGPESRWLRENASAAVVRVLSSSLVTLAQACASGLGLTVLPVNLAALVDGLLLVQPLPEIPPRPVYVVTHPNLRRLPRLRVVANALEAEMRKRLA
jgi:DNA-binding transcriptional LysR family regulator